MIDLAQVRRVSMLDLSVLRRLQEISAKTSGGILEIGSYIGGSTIALASGHMGRRKHAVIDCGGSYPDQPYLPSDDIIRDWRQNVSRFGVADHVRMFNGWSTDSRIFNQALDYIDRDIGLFFFDGDGKCAEQFDVFARYMRPNCALVLDDYWVEPSSSKEKSVLVKAWVDRMTAAGVLGPGELVDGTWFTTLNRMVDFKHFRHFEGYAWMTPAPETAAGEIRMYEDGRPLPHPQSMHVDICEHGGGRYSHWDFPHGPQIVFSTSDNSDPNTNGRRYEIR